MEEVVKRWPLVVRPRRQRNEWSSGGPVTTSASDATVADRLGEMLAALFDGEPPVPVEFWDGSAVCHIDVPLVDS